MKILANGIAVIEGDTHISKWVEQSGRLDHDQNTLPLLAPYIPKGGTVIDVGAFIGDHTVFYAECVGPEGMVIAMEPNSAAFECLAHNARAYGQIMCWPTGASDSEHSIDINRDTNAGASYASEGESAVCTTIDGMYLAACHFIKMDCEGFEVRALKGAFKTIRKFKPVMLIEVNSGALARQGFAPKHIFSILAHLGYKYRNIYLGQPMNGAQYDILCEPI